MRKIILIAIALMLFATNTAMGQPIAIKDMPAVIEIECGTAVTLDLSEYFNESAGPLNYDIYINQKKVPYNVEGSNLTLGPSDWIGTEEIRIVAYINESSFAVQNSNVTIYCSPTPTISGIVTYANASPAEDIAVTLYSGHGKKRVLVNSTTTDSDGAYELSTNEIGEYEIVVDAPDGFRAMPRKQNVEIADVQAQSVMDTNFELKPVKDKKPHPHG